jgi:hypothetical protein
LAALVARLTRQARRIAANIAKLAERLTTGNA